MYIYDYIYIKSLERNTKIKLNQNLKKKLVCFYGESVFIFLLLRCQISTSYILLLQNMVVKLKAKHNKPLIYTSHPHPEWPL